MEINNEFGFDDIVYLKTDVNQRERIVVKYSINKNGILYVLAFGESESTHYAGEISTEKDFVKKKSNLKIGFNKS